MLSQADLNWSAGRLLIVTRGCFVIPAYALYAVRRTQCLMALGVGAGAGRLRRLGLCCSSAAGASTRLKRDLPEALDLMVSGLRAGHSLIAAMALVARECADPVGGEFKICFEEQNYGLEMKAALDNLIDPGSAAGPEDCRRPRS